jgi:F-type H+-transporting ATPase subunit b
MTWDFVSFFLNSEEAFIELNPNILETNIINIGLLVGILLYANKVSFSVGLENRQKEIVQTIENAQKDVVKASNYYYLAEKGLTQSLFWLQSWKALYEKDKVDLVNIKYKLVKTGLTEAFATTENLVKVFENKSFLSLQRYIIFITASKILRKFLFLSETEQSKLIETRISNLGGENK